MPSYTKDYNYSTVDKAVTEYRTQTQSTRSRVKIRNMSSKTAQIILDYINTSEDIPLLVIQGSKNTIEITFLSKNLIPTLITIVGTPVIWKLKENLKKHIAKDE